MTTDDTRPLEALVAAILEDPAINTMTQGRIYAGSPTDDTLPLSAAHIHQGEWCMACIDHGEQAGRATIIVGIDAERARHAALVAAADDYIHGSHIAHQHGHHCAVPLSEDEDDPRCDCGLAALRAALDGEPR